MPVSSRSAIKTWTASLIEWPPTIYARLVAAGMLLAKGERLAHFDR